MSMEKPAVRRLKGLPGPPVHRPLSWYTAQQGSAKTGFHNDWGWLISEGQVPSYLERDSPLRGEKWVEAAHHWLQQHKDGQHQGLDIHHPLHVYLTDAFFRAHPELASPETPSMRRPWLDAGLVHVQRTRSGVEIRYSTTGLIAIGIHSGVNDKWIMPPSLTWHRQHFDEYKAPIAKHGFEHASGKKNVMAWHTYCRQSLNQPGGFSGWSLGDDFMRGWTSGRVHVSETPFSVVLYNLGALSLVDLFHIYPSHKDVFDYIRTHKRMDVLLEKIREKEEQDPLGKEYPRPMPSQPITILSVHGD